MLGAEGLGAVWTGFGPTATGYFLQGAFKFGGYEFFKQQCINQIGYESASRNRTAVYLASSAAAEFFADIALCPLEATRIRLVSEPTFANGLIGGMTKIAKNEGLGAFYSGFGPILFKQYVMFIRAGRTGFLKTESLISKFITGFRTRWPSLSSSNGSRKLSTRPLTSRQSQAAPQQLSTSGLA